MSLKEQLERNRSRADAGLKKSQVQVQLVLPVLTALGWDSSDPSQLDVERRVDVGGTSGTVDVILRGQRGEIVTHVNFVALGEEFPSLVEHTLRLASKGTVQFAVATDGIVWNLYFRDPAKEEPLVLVLRLDLNNIAIDRAVEVLSAVLGRYAMIQGHAASNARELLQTRRSQQLLHDVPRALAELITEADELLVQLVQDRISQDSYWSPALEDISGIMRRWNGNWSQNRPDAVSVAIPTARDSYAQTALHGPARRLSHFVGIHKKSPPATPPNAFAIGRERIYVVAWNDMLFRVTELMYRKHRSKFDQVLDWRGPRRNYVTRDLNAMPDHARPKEIANSGYFLDMNWSAEDCVERAEELLEIFGYRAGDLELEWA